MRRIYFVISFCILTAVLARAEAQQKEVEVSLTAAELVETEPRGIVTTVFLVTSKSSEKRELVTDLTLPEGWSPITRDFPFELEQGKSETRLVSFLVPQRALAGRYEIRYLVRDRNFPSISDFRTLYVVVLSITSLEVKLLEAPECIIGGDSYQASFAVINGSNTKSTVSIKIHSGEGLPYTIDTKKLELAPSESKTVAVTVNTDADIRAILKHRIELIAQILEHKDMKAQAACYVEVLPRECGVGERYHKFPIEIIGSAHVYDRKDEITSGFQTTISGAGPLDESGKRYVKFTLRGPDIRKRSAFGKYDEYDFELRARDYEFGIGDSGFTLSPLTEEYRYGRGVKGKLALNDFTFGAYYQNARWRTPKRETVAGFVNYSVRNKYKLGLNYLKRLDDYGIVSLYGQLEPIRGTDVELELASGEDDYAYLLRVYGRRHQVSYHLKLVHAGPDYPSRYRDINSLSANITAPLVYKMRLAASFQQTKSNLDLDPDLRYARLARYYQLGSVANTFDFGV